MKLRIIKLKKNIRLLVLLSIFGMMLFIIIKQKKGKKNEFYNKLKNNLKKIEWKFLIIQEITLKKQKREREQVIFNG